MPTTRNPTRQSSKPTFKPSFQPTENPTLLPSVVLYSLKPTENPTLLPSVVLYSLKPTNGSQIIKILSYSKSLPDEFIPVKIQYFVVSFSGCILCLLICFILHLHYKLKNEQEEPTRVVNIFKPAPPPPPIVSTNSLPRVQPPPPPGPRRDQSYYKN